MHDTFCIVLKDNLEREREKKFPNEPGRPTLERPNS